MKAASKGQKLRVKRNMRGRPCKADVARTSSGRISTAREPGEAPDVLGRAKRVALFGVAMEDAGTQRSGTVIGRLWISKEISDEQHNALQRYGEQHERYYKTIQAPDSLRSKSGGSVMRIPDDSYDIETVKKWKSTVNAVKEAQSNYNGNLYAALQFIVVKDEPHEHMIGDLRIAANALVRYYGWS